MDISRWRSILLSILTVTLLACSPAKPAASFYGSDISKTALDPDFRLYDHTGKIRQLADFQGKAVLVFFGYTHCPDICPVTMADLAKAVKLLGQRSDEVQVLFVTLDPERDNQQVLARYVPYFDRRFIGLYGTAAQTADIAKRFGIYYARQPQVGQSGYSIDHSAGVYVFDKVGKIRLYLNYGEKPQEIAYDVLQVI